ncbi:UDP-galactose-4-epimerase [Parapedobacter pyrenivorans]|uniref:UDP-galactose-4-epimerase n=1 Tax=Parapedobacter pyrenivorans TaxID=1305674 RepID=A0A917M5F9_9SPHI|nr:NAD-dependent epimerase/dehydratase family protein [Parapedobacter pyrenivorans]GGG80180.1 UDP-galactose-4-epimerase [Parapedobacter pyrenivorans]
MCTKITNVFLTGATGFLGGVLKQELNALNHAVFYGSGNQQSRIDISQPFRLELDQPINIVIHAAGKVHSVPKTEDERQAFYDTNLEGTKNLCIALEGLQTIPKSFIFISSVAVYGADEGAGISESHPLNGGTPYADSKILAEYWLQQWAEDNKITLGILRLPLIAGPNPPGNLGAMIRGIKSGKYLSIGKADARKSMVWIKDVAEIIPVLAEKGGIFNLTDGYHPTFGELEENISLTLGKTRPISVPYWVANGLALAGDIIGSRSPFNSNKLRKITSTLTFDDRKAREELGWTPTRVIEKMREIV